MSKEEVSEKLIDEALEAIMETPDKDINAQHLIKLLAKLIFNLRYDVNDLKLELLKVFREDKEPISVEKGEDNTGELYS